MNFGEVVICTTFLMCSVSGSGLFGPCSSNEECGILDTVCANGTCICRGHFTVKDDTCVHLASPGIPCKSRHDCKDILGARSLCTKERLCACSPFHHLHNRTCVKNRDLDDSCHQDHQCYCGVDCEDKIACIDKTCSCRPGHKKYMTRRCTHDPLYVRIPEPVQPELPFVTEQSNTLQQPAFSSGYQTSTYQLLLLLAVSFNLL